MTRPLGLKLDAGPDLWLVEKRARERAYYQANKGRWKNPDGTWKKASKDVENARARKRYENPETKARIREGQRESKGRKRVFGECPLCLRVAQLVRDHCHKTNKDRGRICGSCNLMLGHAHDDPKTLRRAAAYLLRV